LSGVIGGEVFTLLISSKPLAGVDVLGLWLVIAGFNKDAVKKLDEAH
jgi:hypothetical protein